MSEWDVVLVIVAIVGLFFSIGKPIINLNTNITTLNESIKSVNARQDRFEKCSEKEHSELWEHEDAQDKILEEHKLRLHDLDGK
jgi:hypothetical protein